MHDYWIPSPWCTSIYHLQKGCCPLLSSRHLQSRAIPVGESSWSSCTGNPDVHLEVKRDNPPDMRDCPFSMSEFRRHSEHGCPSFSHPQKCNISFGSKSTLCHALSVPMGANLETLVSEYGHSNRETWWLTFWFRGSPFSHQLPISLIPHHPMSFSSSQKKVHRTRARML